MVVSIATALGQLTCTTPTNQPRAKFAAVQPLRCATKNAFGLSTRLAIARQCVIDRAERRWRRDVKNLLDGRRDFGERDSPSEKRVDGHFVRSVEGDSRVIAGAQRIER